MFVQEKIRNGDNEARNLLQVWQVLLKLFVKYPNEASENYLWKSFSKKKTFNVKIYLA